MKYLSFLVLLISNVLYSQIKLSLNNKNSAVVFWDDMGNYNFLNKGLLDLDTKYGTYYLEYQNDYVKQIFLIPKNIYIYMEEGVGNSLICKDITGYENFQFNFYAHYILDNKVSKEPFLFNRSYLGNNYIQDTKLRDNMINKEYLLQLNYLNKYKINHKLSKDFYDLWQKYFFYKMLEKKLYVKDVIKQLPADYIGQLCALTREFNQDNLLFLHEYKNAAEILAYLLAISKEKNFITTPEKKFKVIIENFNNETRDYLLAKTLETVYTQSWYSDSSWNQLAKLFFDTCRTSIYSDYVEFLYKKRNQKYASSSLLSISQNLNTFEKVTNNCISYIDFWASWCAPCRAEMPASKKLHIEYERKGINFVYISTDENNAAWIKASEQLEISKLSSYLIPNPKNSDLIKKFRINSIPRYMIIGKDGKVINADAPRPSDPKIRELFDELLKK
ncbi:TlpA family protein disulfide reductase [Runella limosa]|uniref:TlpA family protein disulfide reductase n=1 Tax=Runella limosa TaxID=370978 RepID=UPI0006890E08|nr:TlpA disulfide reductase family protein [Runella limosa]